MVSSTSIRSGLKTIGLTALDLIYPRHCPGCDRALHELDVTLCATCSEQIARMVGRAYCSRCGYGVGPYHLDGDACPACRLHRFHYAGLVRVGPHTGVLRTIQLAYKYRRRPDTAPYLSQLLAAAVSAKTGWTALDAVVPIPTTWWRTMRFGPSTVAAIARQVSRITKIPLANVLRVKERRRRQQGLSATQRWKNIKGKFGLKAGTEIEGARLCLIDDVATTGATLSEAAKVLKQHGADEVYAAVITKTDLSISDVSTIPPSPPVPA